MRHPLLPAAVVLAAVAGCTSHVRYPMEARAVPASRSPSMEVFEYRRSPGDLVLREPDDHKHGYVTRRFSMPASFENGQPGNRLTGTYYASTAPGAKPLIVVLPVWGVSEYPSVKMANAILKRSRGGMNVLRVDGKRRLVPWKRIGRSKTRATFNSRIANAAHRLRHAVIDARRLLDWAGTRAEIDTRRIGLVGFSVSAVTGSLVVQSDARVRASALVMGGAEISRIVSKCPGNEKETRQAIMRNLGLSQSEYRRALDEAFDGLDPADYPNRVDPGGILIVDAGRDECIPEASREAWWRALGYPERISMNYSHRGSFLAMTPLGFNFLRREIYDHLAEHL